MKRFFGILLVFCVLCTLQKRSDAADAYRQFAKELL